MATNTLFLTINVTANLPINSYHGICKNEVVLISIHQYPVFLVYCPTACTFVYTYVHAYSQIPYIGEEGEVVGELQLTKFVSM